MSAEGVVIVLKLHDTRLLLQVRRSQGNAAARLNFMTEHLLSLRATRIGPCQAPPFGRSRDIVALGFFIAGHQQRWISVSQDGYDYTLSHTDEWQDVGGAVDRLSASFVFPPASQIAGALCWPEADAASLHRATEGSVNGRYATEHPAHAAPAPALARPISAARLWQLVNERLRRARLARTQG
ncbi:hypothetical protein [Bordetella sp. H567]|uniref:hypothetical protein n=1 Tax=Bordetella sp. H567 TaxID=1697043 RepID=UPI0011AB362F|nr:hypothetical protein [Bordetella sp. H567]